MGTIGSKIKKEKLNYSGLMNFFNQQKRTLSGLGTESEASEYYNLSGGNPVTDEKKALVQKNRPWKIIIFVVGFVLIGMWFWWNYVQVYVSTPKSDARFYSK
jgi:hypothetical protein